MIEYMTLKERPVLFKGDMVRAILEGRKTETRRIVKPQPPEDVGKIYGPEEYVPAKYDRYGDMYPGKPIFGIYDEDGDYGVKCPYGQVGDRLWVRETWFVNSFIQIESNIKPITNL